MNKFEIILEIKKLHEMNDIPPGWGTFQNATGLKKSDWYPEYWFRWSDAIEEAGLKPNEFNKAYSEEFVIQKLIELIQELDHFPIKAELILKSKKDKSFPSHSSFDKLGNKRNRVELILKYLNDQDREEYSNVIRICEEELEKYLNQITNKKEPFSEEETTKRGFVYLIKHGSRNVYKIGKTYNPLRREGEIGIELPEKIKPIHYIETDDPSGIEAYWHRRFIVKRLNGEWFNLLSTDVTAFKKWKRIY